MSLDVEESIKQDIDLRLKDIAKCEIQRERRLKLYTGKDRVIPVLGFLKSYGFIHLAAISCVDWLDDGEFEIVYNLWSYRDKAGILVKTRISRENPEIDTAIPIYEIAETYEREIHEMFGVNFPGNPNLTSLFLEDWNGPPPMRKDFDTRKYAAEKYGMRDLTEQLKIGMDKIKGVRDGDEIL